MGHEPSKLWSVVGAELLAMAGSYLHCGTPYCSVMNASWINEE